MGTKYASIVPEIYGNYQIFALVLLPIDNISSSLKAFLHTNNKQVEMEL